MKKSFVAVMALAAVAVSLSGCATKRYGRMTTLSSLEMDKYSCEQVAIEISKVEQFELEVEKGAEVNWKSVAGFLGDYGIGNAMEKNEAMKSAKERKAQLRQLQIEKGCTLSQRGILGPILGMLD